MTTPKLLLADDSVTIRKVIELTFADEGIDVTSVADGAAAMAKFVEIQPDIVLVDAGLPGTSGYQICEMIKGDESTAHIPVLLLVGTFEPFDHDAAEKGGADGFLTKPFHSIREVVTRVRELIIAGAAAVVDDTAPQIDVQGEPNDDTRDISDLYERSFAETQPIENYETLPAFDQAAALGEETISEAPVMDASHHSVEEWLDDEMIETVHRADLTGGVAEADDDRAVEATAGLQPEENEEPATEIATAVSEYHDSPAAAIDIEPIKEFDWSPAAIVSSASEAEIGAAAGFVPFLIPEESFIAPSVGESTPVEDEDEVTLEQDRGEASEGAEITERDGRDVSPSTAPGIDEPSKEFIDLVVQRVVERLSDKAIREIAQEAVPRIAEKLMREALEDERKG